MHKSIPAAVAASLAFLVAGSPLCHAQGPDASATFISREEALELAADVTADKFPDADNVLIDDYTVETYREDGTGTAINEWYEKILTEKGRRDSRTASLWMNTTYGAVAVKYAELIKPDGSVVPIDVAANSRIMIDPEQMDANIYDPNDKILSVAFPGMEVGDVLHIAVERTTTKPRVPDHFSGYIVLETTSPIIRMTHEIIAPAARPLKKLAVRDSIGKGVAYSADTLDDGSIRHRWSVRDVPQVFPEPGMPAMYTCVQRALVSTMESWEELSRWYCRISEPRMAATVPEMQAEVDALISDAASTEEKVRRLFTFVSQKIRYMGVMAESEAPGYEPHDVSLTYQNKYGVCRDKAALLAEMLRMAGLEAYPVIIHTGEPKDPEVPQLMFNHAVVAVRNWDKSEGAEKYVLMDPTNESSSSLLPEYLCEKSFIVATPDGEGLMQSAAIPAERNMVSIETSAKVQGDRIAARSDVSFKGVNDTIYRSAFADMTANDRRLSIERMVQGSLPGAVITKLEMQPADMQDTSTPLSLGLEYFIPRAVITGGVTVVTLPRIMESFGYVNFLEGRTGLETRRFPIKTDITCGVEEKLELETGFIGAFSWGGNVEAVTNGASFRNVVEASGNNGIVSVKSSFVMSQSWYSPSDYLGLRTMLGRKETSARAVGIWDGTQSAATAEEAPLPLQAAQPDDVLIVYQHTDVFPEPGTNAWSEAVHEQRKILTYAGKMDSGELMFPYNPSTESVELISASVRSPSGGVHEVTDLEMNEMDQPWVSSAPRYPAGKTLVVSLPGLEVGSDVEFKVRRSFHGMPARAFRKYFGGFNDIGRQSITLHGGADDAFTGYEPGGDASIVSVSTSDDGAVTAVCTNLQGIIRDRNMPPSRHLFDGYFSVFAPMTAWDYGRIIESNMLARAHGQERAANKAAELVAGLEGVQEKVRAIRDFLSMEIRDVGVAYHDFPLSMLSDADVTLADGYGHAMDKAILAVSMLQSIGIAPRVMLIDSSRLPQDGDDARVDGNGFLDSVLVAVDDGDATYYANAGSQYADLRTTGADGMFYADLDAGRWMRLEVPEEFADSISTSYSIDVNADGLAVVDVRREYRGTTVDGFRRLYSETTPEDRRRHVLETVSSYARDAALEGDYATDVKSYPATESFRMTIPGWAILEGQDRMSIRLVGSERTAVGPRYGERTLPFYRQQTNRFADSWRIALPEGAASASLLPSANIFSRKDIGTVLTTRRSESRNDDGRIVVTVEREAALERAMFGGDDFRSFMEASLNTQGRASDTVVAEVHAEADGADASGVKHEIAD